MKRQTLVLVVIGLVLFIAGGGIAYATVVAGSKDHGSATVNPVNTPVVVATTNLPAGTTGQAMVAQGLVAIQLIPQKKYLTTDVPSLAGLTDEVLTTSVKKGDAVQATQLTPSTTTISVPKGQDAVTITTTGAAGLAGYLQPGSHVDVYANITKVTAGQNSDQSQSAGLPVPCTQLVMSGIEVLDVSNVVPALGTHPSAAGRTVPLSMTLLLAVYPSQAQEIAFMSANETLSVVQSQKSATPPPPGVCIGTGQYSVAP
ncbi:MAG: RcpC/CpaB family pilus assembly protein [Acidimicrobiales bacterium]